MGFYPNNVSQALTEYDSANAAIEVFIAEQIGELIAIAPHLTCLPTQDTAKVSITKCVEHFFDGNFRAFGRLFGLRKGGDYFYGGKPRLINLELLLRVAFHTGTTLLNLLTNENALADFDPSSLTGFVGKRLSPRLKKENVRAKLLQALEEDPPPSLNEIAKRLGYRHGTTLRCYFPQISDQVRANHLAYSQGKRRGGCSMTRLQSNEVIRDALETALKEEPPPTLGKVARSLGYVSPQALRPKFPDLCKALTEKRRKIMSDRRAKIEGELRQAIESNPPIYLGAISEKLGYKTTATLRTAFPNECREIRERHEKYNKNQLLLKIGAALQSILIELPPPPLNTALRRIGVSDGFLRKHFPHEHRTISSRYLEFRHQQSSENKENERKKIRAIVLDLIKREVLPSMNKVLEQISTTYLRRTEVWATILEAREELAHSA
jgi:AraC-like DNA-binding protein